MRITACSQAMPHHQMGRQGTVVESTLSFGSHNVNGACGGLGVRLAGFVRSWCIHRLAIVCVQETHLTNTSAKGCEILINEIAGKLGHSGWTAWWSHGTGSSAGVGILISRGLMESGRLKLRKNLRGKHDIDIVVPSRVIQLALDWGGHCLSVGCLYLPSSDPSGQRKIITDSLGPMGQSNRAIIWGGDYNFAENVSLDRCSRAWSGNAANRGEMPAGPPPPQPVRVSARQRAAVAMAAAAAEAEMVDFDNATLDTAPPTGSVSAPNLGPTHQHQDTKTALLLKVACPELVDSFRRLHPRRKAYTYIHSRWASRIDRFMASSSLSPFIISCDNLVNSTGDHRPIGLLLVAKRSAARVGKGLKRTRVHFFSDVVLREELAVWLQDKMDHRPLGDDMLLLEWWAGFKTELVRRVAALNKVANHKRLFYLGEVVESARLRLERATLAVDTRGGGAGALEEAIKARKYYADVTKPMDRGLLGECRRDWVRGKEQPSPLITKLTQPPQGDKQIVALRDPSGRLEDDPCRLPAIVAKFWVATSRASQTNEEAKTRVLAPLRGDALRQVDEGEAAALGDTTVSAKEVRDALKKTKGGNSPGPDGIPYVLYNKYKDLFSPVLSDIFSAIGRLGETPRGFLDGVISVIFKKGDRTIPANYRPITLLNTDYRLLAKALASRLGNVLKGIISAEQTAFLGGRNIGENILLMKLLPGLFKSRGHVGVIAFCDFAKAYDTVDRDFLF